MHSLIVAALLKLSKNHLLKEQNRTEQNRSEPIRHQKLQNWGSKKQLLDWNLHRKVQSE
jgi:actin-related protein